MSAPIQAVFIETEPDTLHLNRLKQIANGRGLTVTGIISMSVQHTKYQQ